MLNKIRSHYKGDDIELRIIICVKLAKGGGTSILASVGFFTLFLVATFLMSFLLDLLFARG